jgi:hypothetical protein
MMVGAFIVGRLLSERIVNIDVMHYTMLIKTAFRRKCNEKATHKSVVVIPRYHIGNGK